MKVAVYTLLAALLYIAVGASTALANTSTVSNDPSYAAGPFQFYCPTYLSTFEEDKHYIPFSNQPNCRYSIPAFISAEGRVIVSTYKGTVGNAKILSGDLVYFTGTLIERPETSLVEIRDNGEPIFPQQDDDFFSVVFAVDPNNINDGATAFNNYFTTGTPPPNNNYKILRWKWGAKPASEFDPVIIVPGILGSWEKNGTWILDPMLHTYDNLINTFIANGYIDGKTIFAFPYDWEQSNIVTAQLLKQKIDQVKTVCNCNKVDLITHSMGGLVASQYITSGVYQNDVDQFFMLGTPLAGSAKAYMAWETGDVSFVDPKINFLLKRVFDREASLNGYTSIFEYIRNKPILSIQELLPVWQNYLQNSTGVLTYPTGYPRNTFLENIVGDFTSYFEKVNAKIQTYVIVGDTGLTSTISGYVTKPSTQLPKWEHGEPIATKFGLGDGTVLFDSATLISGPEKEFKGVAHTDLSSSSAPYIFKQLNNRDVTSIVGKKYTSFDTDLSLLIAKIAPSPNEFKVIAQTVNELFLEGTTRTILFILLFSPIDMQITAPDGKKIGKDFATGNSLSEIPNARYSAQVGEHEYAVILDPLPGEYKVDTAGTGNGVYTIAASYMSAATTSIFTLAGTTTLNQAIQNTMTLSSTTTVVSIQPPTATLTPTTTQITPDTCITDITQAYKDKWIGKKAVYEKLVFDCKVLKELFKARDLAKNKPVLNVIYAAIRLTLADMDLLAKDKDNTKDAVLLITKITTWLRNHELR